MDCLIHRIRCESLWRKTLVITSICPIHVISSSLDLPLPLFSGLENIPVNRTKIDNNSCDSEWKGRNIILSSLPIPMPHLRLAIHSFYCVQIRINLTVHGLWLMTF
jgi:hypothetical protein